MPLWGSMPANLTHAGAASPRQQSSDPSVSGGMWLSSQLMSTFRGSAAEEAASSQILKLCAVLCIEHFTNSLKYV